MLEAFVSPIAYRPDVDWKHMIMLNATLREGPSLGEGDIVSQAQLEKQLQTLRLVGEETALAGIPFKKVFSLRLDTKANLSALVYRACTQKPPDNHSEHIYEWWARSVPELCTALESKLRDKPKPRKQDACASFDSYVKLMSNGLNYLDRFYVRRLGLTTVASIGQEAKERLRQALDCVAAIE